MLISFLTYTILPILLYESFMAIINVANQLRPFYHACGH